MAKRKSTDSPDTPPGKPKRTKSVSILTRSSAKNRNEAESQVPTSSNPRESPPRESPPHESQQKNERDIRRRRKKMRGKLRASDAPEDATSQSLVKLKRQVKYFVNQIKRERNLIDAYSNEGWKGQSREKVRPEKELQRATAQIIKLKLKIRQAMQELDTISSEGSIRDSAFDEDGQLDYQEIFCCKCQSHDTEADNDIILCDGACNRGFHQKCLNPPLATTDIPPGDEGWMCPACDCKEDLVAEFNDYLGTDFDIEAKWEQFFPEAVEQSNSVNANDIVDGILHEDSDDDDYDPENKEENKEDKQEANANENINGHKEASDESSDGDEDEEDNYEDSDDVSTDLSREEPLSGAEDVNEDGDSKHNESEEQKEGEEQDKEEKQGEEHAEELVTGKRKRNEVDYRRLNDEMFGLTEEEVHQSEDEDYGGPIGRQSRRVSSNGGLECDDKSKRIPVEAVQRLRGVFEENQLPSRTVKEDLSKELGLSYRKVDVWFKNVRMQAIRSGLAKPTRVRSKRVKEHEENDLLLGKLSEVEFKLQDLKRIMEVAKVKHTEERVKRVIYVPVSAQVVEKEVC